MSREYESAIHLLNSRKALPKPDVHDMQGSDDMVKWLELIGHSMDDINGLHIIHVSGTNGKGSVCAFTASFLQTHQQVNGYPRKIGLYTSPHIKSIRERIQINGAPISENVFRERFFQVWDKLPKEASSELDIPRYLQLLTLVSYHVFITEHVDVAVYETHLGGEFDATNIVVNPLATAVTRVAEDHIHLLGPTIEDIAWHKGGIFKSGAPALSSFQSPPVARILQQRAEEKTVQLEFIGTNPELDGLAYSWLPEVQKANCSLALTLTRVYLEARGSGSDKLLEVTELLAACKQPVWPGRFQHIKKGSLQLYIDGAHNKPSIPHAVHWFADSIANQNASHTPTRILIFSHFSQRDGDELLTCVANCLRENDIAVDNVIFTSYNERKDGSHRIDRNLRNRFDSQVLEGYKLTWENLEEIAAVYICDTIEESLSKAEELASLAGGADTLVLGSLHLVSGVLCVLDPAGARYLEAKKDDLVWTGGMTTKESRIFLDQ